jgi:hypothetical protein
VTVAAVSRKLRRFMACKLIMAFPPDGSAWGGSSNPGALYAGGDQKKG